ncbi:MAG: DUF309 domain-containing protein [Campylobacterota bacterium]|nr:DUF309 domain-containing protein [Campylobacterota bacterium]
MTNIKEFTLLVEDEKYIEAHEVLEHDWIEFKKTGESKKAKLYKALINGATSIALYKMNRSKRAVDITWGAFLKAKPLLENIDIENKSDYYAVIDLLEKRENSLV